MKIISQISRKTKSGQSKFFIRIFALIVLLYPIVCISRFAISGEFTYGCPIKKIQHVRVAADGFKTLVTQHYPEAVSKKGGLDLVLIAK